MEADTKYSAHKCHKYTAGSKEPQTKCCPVQNLKGSNCSQEPYLGLATKLRIKYHNTKYPLWIQNLTNMSDMQLSVLSNTKKQGLCGRIWARTHTDTKHHAIVIMVLFMLGQKKDEKS